MFTKIIPLVGWSGQNWNFIKIALLLHHLKALNERISEWAHFLNLAKWFRRYLNFRAPKNGVFSDKPQREVTYLKWHQKEDFWRAFCNLLGINTHNFVQNGPKFENKSLFYAEFCGAWYEKFFRLQSFDIWGLETKN